MTAPAPETRIYVARADGWVAGRRVRKGEAVALTPAAAAYEPVDPAPPAAPARAARKRATRRAGE